MILGKEMEGKLINSQSNIYSLIKGSWWTTSKILEKIYGNVLSSDMSQLFHFTLRMIRTWRKTTKHNINSLKLMTVLPICLKSNTVDDKALFLFVVYSFRTCVDKYYGWRKKLKDSHFPFTYFSCIHKLQVYCSRALAHHA
jgi:hypothetical protein